MNRRLMSALALACIAPSAWADSLPTMRIGVLNFKAADAASGGTAASDIFSAALYRNFPGLSVVGRAEIEAALSDARGDPRAPAKERNAVLLQRLLGLDAVMGGTIMALDLDPKGGDGTLMMSARLVRLPAGEILWADTRTVRLGASLLKARDSDAVLTGKLLELAVFQLVQDLGKRLPKEALVAAPRRAPAKGSDGAPETCEPAFYRSLPRDRDWYYGAGKDRDTEKARAAALSSLAKQATGISTDGGALRGLVAGWEQDDQQSCNGASYVLVRIQKKLVDRIGAQAPARSAAEFARPPSPTGMDIENRILAAALADKAVATMQTHLRSGRVPAQLVRANAGFTRITFADLVNQRKACGVLGCLDTPTPDENAHLARARIRLNHSGIMLEDVVRVHAIHLNYSLDEEDREFLDGIINRKEPVANPSASNFTLARELAFPLAWSAAMSGQDWSSYFKYCGDYLRNYRDGVFAKAAEENRRDAAEILMRRNNKYNRPIFE